MATFLVWLVLVVPSALWRGFVLMKLWAWFVVPMFALPALTLIPAIGLSLVVSYLTHQPSPPTDDTVKSSTRISHMIVLAALWPAIGLGAGWIVAGFMP